MTITIGSADIITQWLDEQPIKYNVYNMSCNCVVFTILEGGKDDFLGNPLSLASGLGQILIPSMLCDTKINDKLSVEVKPASEMQYIKHYFYETDLFEQLANILLL